MRVIEENAWSDFVDLRAKVMSALQTVNVYPHTVMIKTIVHPSQYSVSNIRVDNNDFSIYGENYIVVKRMGTCCHHNYRMIVAW